MSPKRLPPDSLFLLVGRTSIFKLPSIAFWMKIHKFMILMIPRLGVIISNVHVGLLIPNKVFMSYSLTLTLGSLANPTQSASASNLQKMKPANEVSYESDDGQTSDRNASLQEEELAPIHEKEHPSVAEEKAPMTYSRQLRKMAEVPEPKNGSIEEDSGKEVEEIRNLPKVKASKEKKSSAEPKPLPAPVQKPATRVFNTRSKGQKVLSAERVQSSDDDVPNELADGSAGEDTDMRQPGNLNHYIDTDVE
jgi:hypothetical protein